MRSAYLKDSIYGFINGIVSLAYNLSNIPVKFILYNISLTCPYVPFEYIYFGDFKSDIDAANEYNFDYIFVKNYSDWENGVNICKLKNIKIIGDFTEVS